MRDVLFAFRKQGKLAYRCERKAKRKPDRASTFAIYSHLPLFSGLPPYYSDFRQIGYKKWLGCQHLFISEMRPTVIVVPKVVR
jgi:hypothetical protein